MAEYPDGKLNKDDEGATLMAIGRENGYVMISFPKQIEWIALPPEQAVVIAQKLVEQARLCGCKTPLTFFIGK